MSEEAVISRENITEGVMQAPVGIAVFNAADLTVKMANSFYLKMVDRQEHEVVGRPLFEAFPEIRKVAEPLIAEVLEKRLPYFGNEVAFRLRRYGRYETAYFNFIYQPVTDSTGSVHSIMLVANEVTELVRGRQLLKESEEKFRLIVAESPIAMAILRGRDLIVEIANPAILRTFFNRDLRQIEGRKLFNIFPEMESQTFPQIFEQVFRTGQRYSEKDKHIYIDNSSCNYIDLECTALYGEDNNVSGLLVTVTDVSEKVRTRKKVEYNEARLRMVIEASGLGTWELNLKTNEFAYSDEYLATFGLTRHASHEELLALMHPDDREIRQNAFQQALATGWLHYVSRLIWEDKSIHWIEAHGKVIYDENGQPFKMMGTSRDITEEKLYQQGIKESEEKFRLLADSLPQFIWTGDTNGNLTYFNRSVYDYSGMTFEALKGQGWIEIVHPDDRAANIKKWWEAVKKGGSFLFEHRFRRYDGRYRWQLSRATPQYDAHGRIQMWVGTSTDIHDQKAFARELEEKVFERTRELKATNEALEKTNRELEQFAYIASHDLQEPLRKIMTFSDILKKNIHDTVSAQKYFSKIDSSAQRMGDLIRSVLDYSRLPAQPGQSRLTDLNEILSNVKADLELSITEKGAAIQSGMLPAVPGMPLQLHQLFSNLIGNALKFCISEPCITINGALIHGRNLTGLFNADDSKQYAKITFQDNGIGFENRYKEQIFTIFQRLHGWQQYTGTGIGLALCKKIVENHYGYITAESEPGKGSTFIVYLPA